jgi:hypothetical protein
VSAPDLRQLERALDLLLGKRKPSGSSARAQLTRARKIHAAWLHGPDVAGIGIGHRSTDGVELAEPVLRVHVRDKRPAAEVTGMLVPPAIRLPGVAGVIPIDVVDGSTIKLQSACCGDAIACSGNIGWGTIACLVKKKEFGDKVLALSSAHVLPAPLHTDVDWLGYPGTAGNTRQRLGRMVLRHAPIESSDAEPWPNLFEIALVEAVLPIEVDPGRLAPAVGFRMTDLAMNEEVVLWGAASGKVRGRVIETRHHNHVVADNRIYGFANLLLHSAPTQAGDSGAAVMDAQNRIAGLHLGVNKLGQAVMTPIAPIIRRFGLDLVMKARNFELAACPVMLDERGKAIDVLARTLWGEARSESTTGREAVANVVINRVRSQVSWWGTTIESVCRAPKQFSCWNAGDPNRPKLEKVDCGDKVFAECLQIARRAANGSLPDITHGSKHYHTRNIRPSWLTAQKPVLELGNHLFYNDIP